MWASDSRVRLRHHLHQTEMGETIHREPRAVGSDRRVERIEHGGAVFRQVHVDEIDDDDAAEIAQAQLPRDGLRRLQVGLEDGVVERAHADETAGVDVDGGQRLGLVDDQIAAALEVDAAMQRPFDLLSTPYMSNSGRMPSCSWM